MKPKQAFIWIGHWLKKYMAGDGIKNPTRPNSSINPVRRFAPHRRRVFTVRVVFV